MMTIRALIEEAHEQDIQIHIDMSSDNQTTHLWIFKHNGDQDKHMGSLNIPLHLIEETILWMLVRM